MCKIILKGLIAVSIFPSASAIAATGDVIFNGNVLSSCLLVVVPTGGTMTSSADLTSLSSKNLLGLPGIVNVTTTGGVTLSVDPVVVTNIRPVEDTGTINWTPSFSSLGVHTFLDRTAPMPLTLPGLSAVSVHLAGVKSSGGTFAAGPYRATVTVTCE
ncbi:MAG: hypothetical protein WBF87_12665 [Mesorhizobium sp.]